MKYLSFLLVVLLISCTPEKPINNPQWAIVIHGGAGDINPDNLSVEKQKAYKVKLTEALEVGSAILKNGGTSLDAVEATIHIMENSPLFNAGKGAVFNAFGQNEMDASIMYGKTGKAGAVAGVRHIKNPISAAIAVMEQSPHVLLIGQGAEDFAQSKQVEIVDTSYFFTERKWESYKKLKQEKYGTVGCVALDKQGHITAGTSTGGMTMKMAGRVGDSPIIGAGTYADNSSCGISATGHGEFFMRHLVAYDIAALMKYSQLSISQAAQEVIQNKLKPIGGSGGVIGLDKAGNIITEFNTQGMFRGHASELQEIEVAIFK